MPNVLAVAEITTQTAENLGDSSPRGDGLTALSAEVLAQIGGGQATVNTI